MLVAIPFLGSLVLVAMLLWWCDRRHLARRAATERHHHRLYLRSLRRAWVRRWLYGERTLRLTARPATAEPGSVQPSE